MYHIYTYITVLEVCQNWNSIHPIYIYIQIYPFVILYEVHTNNISFEVCPDFVICTYFNLDENAFQWSEHHYFLRVIILGDLLILIRLIYS